MGGCQPTIPGPRPNPSRPPPPQVNPQFYAFRWITLLLTQEFSFPDSLRLWDTLLADPAGRTDCLLRLCVAMLLNVREELMQASGCMRTCMCGCLRACVARFLCTCTCGYALYFLSACMRACMVGGVQWALSLGPACFLRGNIRNSELAGSSQFFTAFSHCCAHPLAPCRATLLPT